MDLTNAEKVAAYVVVTCGGLTLQNAKKRRNRRWWMTSVNKSRTVYNATNLLVDLLREPSGQFENFCRMSSTDFNYLLQKVEAMIAKEDTKFRKAIPAVERLAVTLRFLGTGDSFESLHYLFKFSASSISTIVPEVCTALIKVLQNYIKFPKNAEDWKTVSEGFEKAWNFPHCIGAMDGKHVTMQCPRKSGSDFYNYKQNFSIVLMALVDAEYCFLFADCGSQGRLSDGAVYQHTTLFHKIEQNQLNCPPDEPLEGRDKPVPYVIVGDDAFGLCPRIMEPFRGQQEKGSKSRIYNYRLSRARRVVENTFGILASVFRVLRKPMLLEPHRARLVVMTCILLHNFLRTSKTSRSLYTPTGTFDHEENGALVPGFWREDTGDASSLLPIRKIPRKCSMNSQEIRNEFAEYFVSNGKVDWQEAYQ